VRGSSGPPDPQVTHDITRGVGVTSDDVPMHKETFDVFCPTCNILVEAKVIARASGDPRSKAPSLFDEVDNEYHGDRYTVALCQRCDGPFLVRESLHGVPGEFEVVTDETILYPVTTGTKMEELPESVARSMDQAYRSISTSSYDACALMCRRALEALCQSFSANGDNLAIRLADLKEKGHIDGRLLDWAHGVRLVGNEAAHDVETAVTADDARDILEFIEALLMYVFTLDAKFRSFMERRKGYNGGSSIQRPDK